MSVEGWQEISLGNILFSRNDKSKQIKSSEYLKNGSYPIIDQSSDFICGYCDDIKKVISNGLPYIVFGDHTRHTKFIDFPFVVGADGTQIIKSTKEVDDLFFFYLVLYAAERIGNYGYDRHFKHLKQFICDYPIDQSEQTQIATILSTIDRAIEQTEALIAKQQRIKTGLMQDLLTKGIDENGNIRSEETHEFKDSPLGRIPVEWEVISIGEKARVRSGSTPSRSNDKFWIDGTVPWVKTSEVCFSKITETEEKITEEALKLTSLHLEPINSILVAMYGQGGTRGRCAILGIEATMNQACAAILGKQGEINQEYLFYYLSFQYNELRTIGHGSNQTNLNGNLLRAFFIKLPSYKEQVIIAYSFNQLKQRQDQLTSELSKFNSLKKGLMQDLLTGKVRVIDLLNQKTAAN